MADISTAARPKVTMLDPRAIASPTTRFTVFYCLWLNVQVDNSLPFPPSMPVV